MKELALQWWDTVDIDSKQSYATIHHFRSYYQLTSEEISIIFEYEVVNHQNEFNKRVLEYLVQFEGKEFYNEIALAIQFGYSLNEI